MCAHHLRVFWFVLVGVASALRIGAKILSITPPILWTGMRFGLWNLDQVRDAGFNIVADEREPPASSAEVGGPVTRILTAQSEEPCQGQIDATESRP
jgi:hypothetical protein